jgi:hypothetical protein
MPKFVVLGSCRHEPYEVLIMPNRLNNEPEDPEKAYVEACKKFYPAMDKADIIIVYNPDYIVGEHTQKDIDYARSKGKKVIFTHPTELDSDLHNGH